MKLGLELDYPWNYKKAHYRDESGNVIYSHEILDGYKVKIGYVEKSNLAQLISRLPNLVYSLLEHVYRCQKERCAKAEGVEANDAFIQNAGFCRRCEMRETCKDFALFRELEKTRN